MLSLSSEDPWSSVEHSRLREKQILELSSIRARAGTWTSDWSQRPALSRPAALGPSPIILKQPEKPRKPSQQTHIQMIGRQILGRRWGHLIDLPKRNKYEWNSHFCIWELAGPPPDCPSTSFVILGPGSSNATQDRKVLKTSCED